MPLKTYVFITGSPNFFIRGPHKLLHKSAWAEHLTYWDCFGICHILPNQEAFRQSIFHFSQKYSRAGFGRGPQFGVPAIEEIEGNNDDHYLFMGL